MCVLFSKANLLLKLPVSSAYLWNMDERVALAKENATAMVPVIRVESHGLATPGKRLLWHLSHLRFKTGNCFFAGTPVSLERCRLT